MSIKKLALLIITLSLIISFSADGAPPELNQEANFYKIDQIKQKKYQSPIFYTEGFVVKIYTCPECRPSEHCKPCMKNNIVISENNTSLKAYYLTEKELIIFTENPKQFKIGKKYKFLLKLTDIKSTSEPINDIELLQATEINR